MLDRLEYMTINESRNDFIAVRKKSGYLISSRAGGLPGIPGSKIVRCRSGYLKVDWHRMSASSSRLLMDLFVRGYLLNKRREHRDNI